MLDEGLFGLIRDLYPVSTIMIILTGVSFLWAYIPRIIHIRSLEKQLGIRAVKEQK